MTIPMLRDAGAHDGYCYCAECAEWRRGHANERERLTEIILAAYDRPQRRHERQLEEYLAHYRRIRIERDGHARVENMTDYGLPLWRGKIAYSEDGNLSFQTTFHPLRSAPVTIGGPL